MRGTVRFIGGELDGQIRVLPEILPIYYVPRMTRKQLDWSLPNGQDLGVNTMPEIQHTEYVLTRQYGAPIYVERELIKLGDRQGIDPRPDLESIV